MPKWFLSWKVAAAVILAGLAVGALDLGIRGYAVVHDPRDLLVGAEIEDADGPRPMREFATGHYAARPRGDGTFRLRCRSGLVIQRGYVTAGMKESYTVSADDCRRPA
ncbi:hypothetical protein [Sphingomonas sp.]|uniref:hypothetical protein n=1 Tax=Sphingomonas sp. TaxID=28214 RepID=UPI0035B4DE3A